MDDENIFFWRQKTDRNNNETKKKEQKKKEKAVRGNENEKGKGSCVTKQIKKIQIRGMRTVMCLRY